MNPAESMKTGKAHRVPFSPLALDVLRVLRRLGYVCAGFKDWPRRGIVRRVIRSFKDRRTRRFFEGHRVAAFQGFADQAVRPLTLLASAKSLGDLAALPSNRLESLRGDREGQYSIRIQRAVARLLPLEHRRAVRRGDCGLPPLGERRWTSRTG